MQGYQNGGKIVQCLADAVSYSLSALIDSVNLVITVHIALIRFGLWDFANYKKRDNFILEIK